MTAPERRAPRLSRARVLNNIKHERNFSRKQPDLTASRALQYILGSIDGGHLDLRGTYREAQIMRSPLRRYLKRGINYCDNHPDVTVLHTLEMLTTAIQSGQFDPMTKDEALDALRSRVQARTALGDPGADFSRENGAQSRTAAYAGLIDTEDYDTW